MTTTMPPVVQNLSPAPPRPAPKKQAGPADAAPSAATAFRNELGRRQQTKRPEARDATGGGKPAGPEKGKRARSTGAPKRKSAPVDETPPQDAADTAKDAAAAESKDQLPEPTEPTAEAVQSVADEAGTAKEHDDGNPEAPATSAGALAAPVQPVPSDETETEARSDAPADTDTAFRLASTEAVAEATSQDASPQDEEPAAADGAFPLHATKPTARGDAAPATDAVAPTSNTSHRPRHAPDGDSGPQQQPWRPAANSAAGVQPIDPGGQDAGAKPAGDVRDGAINVTALPAFDLSAKHQSVVQPPGHAPPLSAQDVTPPELRFAVDNHENIVKAMRADLLPNGGLMRIKLDPPQLGALQVTVQIRDGLVTAAFETSNDEATRLLGHSLGQLKTVLESHGISVDKLQVQQSPRDERTPTGGEDQHRREQPAGYEQEHAARQEQQRREMLRKMWRRLSGVADPLDVTG